MARSDKFGHERNAREKAARRSRRPDTAGQPGSDVTPAEFSVMELAAKLASSYKPSPLSPLPEGTIACSFHKEVIPDICTRLAEKALSYEVKPGAKISTHELVVLKLDEVLAWLERLEPTRARIAKQFSRLPAPPGAFGRSIGGINEFWMGDIWEFQQKCKALLRHPRLGPGGAATDGHVL